jgi:hypothetical protein
MSGEQPFTPQEEEWFNKNKPKVPEATPAAQAPEVQDKKNRQRS